MQAQQNILGEENQKRERQMAILASHLIKHDKVVFKDHYFMFTEPFYFGSRKTCAEAVIARGGIFMDKKRPTRDLHYLVLGEKESAWMDGCLVGKIEAGLELIEKKNPLKLITETEFVMAIGEAPFTQQAGYTTSSTVKKGLRLIYKKPLPEANGCLCKETHLKYLNEYVESALNWRNVYIELPFDLDKLAVNQGNVLAKDLREIRRNPFLFSEQNPDCELLPRI
jgi:hypothetical protein